MNHDLVTSRRALLFLLCTLCWSWHVIAFASTSVSDAQQAVQAAQQRIENTRQDKSQLSSEIGAKETRLDQLKAQGPPCHDYQAAIFKAGEELGRLRFQEATTLADFRQGYFCSKCNRSKTEIEATGENFYDHIRRVDGQIIPASAEKLAEKQKEFDDKIRDVEGQLNALQDQQRACVDGYDKDVASVLAEIQELQSRWWELQQAFCAATRDYLAAQNQAAMLARQEEQQALLAKQQQLEKAKREAEEEGRKKRAQQFEEERRSREQLEREQAQKKQNDEQEKSKKEEKESRNFAGPWLADTNAGNSGTEESPANQSPGALEQPGLERQESTSPNESALSSLQRLIQPQLPSLSDTKDRLVDAFQRAKDLMKEKLGDDVFDSATNSGPSTPDDLVHSEISSVLTDLSKEPAEQPGSTLITAIKEKLIDSISDKLAEKFRQSVIALTTPQDFAGESNDQLSVAQREFEMTVSPSNLVYQTFPFYGAKAIRGLHHYLNDAQDNFFSYFGLATDRILDSEEGK